MCVGIHGFTSRSRKSCRVTSNQKRRYNASAEERLVSENVTVEKIISEI